MTLLRVWSFLNIFLGFTHIMAFYDICHMTKNVINHGNMGIKRTVSDKIIDLGFQKRSNLLNFPSKIKKIKFVFFFCIFLANPFVRLNGLESK